MLLSLPPGYTAHTFCFFSSFVRLSSLKDLQMHCEISTCKQFEKTTKKRSEKTKKTPLSSHAHIH